MIELDKVAELRNAYLTAWQLTIDLRYEDAGLRVRAGARRARPSRRSGSLAVAVPRRG